MNENLTQKDRIILFLNKQGISKNTFYIKTGIANGTLDKKSGITGDTISKIYAAYPEINLEWLIAGEGEMLKSKFHLYDNLLDLRDKYAALAHVSPESVSEEKIMNINSPLEYIPIFTYGDSHQFEGYISIPKLTSCDGAGYVKSDSMYPLVKPGDIVCYKMANNTGEIYWGQMYLVRVIIEGEEYLTIKYLQKSELGEEYVCLASHNPKYQPRDILLENVHSRALIKASINYNSIL